MGIESPGWNFSVAPEMNRGVTATVSIHEVHIYYVCGGLVSRISFPHSNSSSHHPGVTREHAYARYSAMLDDMFCHQCGHENRPGAKFCEECGASTTAPGGAESSKGIQPGAGRTQLGLGSPVRPEPEATSSSRMDTPSVADPGHGVGMGAHSESQVSMGGGMRGGYETGAPYAGGGDSMLSVSLRAIGVQPAWRAWTTVILILGGFTLVGGVLTYFLVGGETEVVGGAEEDDPFLIGAAEPVVEAETTGSEQASVDGGASLGEPEAEEQDQPARRASARARTTRRTGDRDRAGASRVTTVVGGTGGNAASGASTRTTAETGREEGGRSAAELARSAGDPSTGTPSASGGTDSSDEARGSAPAAGGLPTEAGSIEDRDIAMSMYVSRVRFTVRRYYASRAQNCFDRATRNNPTLSGTAVVGLTIGSDGYVQSTRLARNSTGDAALGACLTAQARSWRLPVPPQAPLTVQLPFSR